ncbi:hypothetical protein BJ912DRAFT_590493 [Pholiota molesta]|nr:hypothetical protein BJ912DRAFT_590493 [Pholiota molesta]
MRMALEIVISLNLKRRILWSRWRPLASVLALLSRPSEAVGQGWLLAEHQSQSLHQHLSSFQTDALIMEIHNTIVQSTPHGSAVVQDILIISPIREIPPSRNHCHLYHLRSSRPHHSRQKPVST